MPVLAGKMYDRILIKQKNDGLWEASLIPCMCNGIPEVAHVTADLKIEFKDGQLVEPNSLRLERGLLLL